MKDKFKGIIVALMLLGLAYLVPTRSDAGINAVKQSIGKNKIYNNGFKKDSAPTKPDNVAPLKKESKKLPAQTSFKPNIEFWKKQLKISKKKQVPKQALKSEKGQQLKRISEPLAQPPQRIKDTGFPDLSHNDNAEENEVKDAVSAIKNAVYGYDAETALNLMGQSHELYSKFPKWAALVRFLLAELISKVILSVYDTKRVLDLESYRQIIDIYSSYKGTDSVYDYIISQSLDRLERWKPMQNQYETGCVDAYKQIAERIQIIEDLKKDHTVNEGPPTDDSFDIEYSALVTNYMSLTDTLLVLRDDESAYNSMREMEKVFKSIPDQITVNYEEYQNGNPWEPIIKKTKTYQITKETTRYLTSVKNYAQTFAILGGLDYRNEPSNYYKPEIIKAVNEIKDYKITTHDNITQEVIEGFKKELDSYDKESEISKITFATNEGIEILPETIVDPKEMINVRGTTDMTGVLYSQKVSVKSNVSKREKNLTLKSDMFYVGLFKNFMPNTNEDSNNENLIKKHGKEKDELKHTICIADGYQYLQEYYSSWNPFYEVNPFKKIINDSNFFKNGILGKGVTRKIENDKIDTMSIRKKFLDKMGYEVVTASFKDYQANIYIANQADWFIYIGHGDYTKGALIIKDRANNRYAQCAPVDPIPGYDPNDFFKTKNINLNFLILGGCQLIKADVKFTPGLSWGRMFGAQTVILGYADYTYPRIASYAVSYLTDYLEKNNANIQYPYEDNFKKDIIEQWVKINYDLSKTIFSIYSSQYANAKAASAIFDKTYYTFKDANKVLKVKSDNKINKTKKTNYEIIEIDISSIL